MKPWMFLVLIAAVLFFVMRKPGKSSGKPNSSLPAAQPSFSHFADSAPKPSQEGPPHPENQQQSQDGGPQAPKSHIPIEGNFEPPHVNKPNKPPHKDYSTFTSKMGNKMF